MDKTKKFKKGIFYTSATYDSDTIVSRKKEYIVEYAPSEGHLDLRQTAWYVLPQTGIMGGRHGT